MNRDNTPWAATPCAELEWNAREEPVSSRFADIYYASENGLAESKHVFLDGSDLPARWSQSTDKRFCVAETGFGTGLNFLLTWQTWRAQPAPKPRLHYIAVEQYPLDRLQLLRALQAWPELAGLTAELAVAWPGRLPGQHRISFDGGAVVLDLWWEEASVALADMACLKPTVDAWYLDGFAPSRNADMWQPALFSAMAALSRPGASIATFTAAGAVRRGLEAAGFKVQKVPGFGRKRESMTGRLTVASSPLPHTDTPWDLPPDPAKQPGSAIVIGAGLAGATLAHTLATRGITVTVIDSGGVADAASGNEQGILYTRLSRKHSSLTDFALQSFRHASTFYRQLFRAGLLAAPEDGQLCGNFQQHRDEDELAAMQDQLTGLEDLAQVLQPDQAREHLGVTPALPGYWYPDSGWLRPGAVCAALLDSALITLLTHCGPVSLAGAAAGWRAIDAKGQNLASADIAVVCAGVSSSGLAQLDWLPLQAIRGQTTLIPATKATHALRAGLCHTGYIAPATNGQHCVGSSFKLRDDDLSLRAAEHQENLDKLSLALPQWQAQLESLDTRELQGRVGFRCASPDYLPIAGPVPERNRFLQDYAALRKNARKPVFHRGTFVPGLYVNTAHGSRGLTSAPLCAQLLAAHICNEPAPVSRTLQRAVSPARFLVRDLARNRI